MKQTEEKQSKVSVIIPVFNRESLVEKCLKSITAQNYPFIEIIVVDNGSTDFTPDVVRRFINNYEKKEKEESNKKVIKLLEEKKRGASAARNRGLQEATGDYIIFFDSDDEMHHDLVRKAVSKFISDPQADIVCWKCRIHLLDGKTKVPRFIPQDPWEGHLIHTLLRPQGYMAKKSLLVATKGWNENLPVWNDWEFGVRILSLKPKVVWRDEILAEIYSQKDSITGESFSAKEGKWEISLTAATDFIQNLDSDNSSDKKDIERIKRMLGYKKIILACQYEKERNKNGAKTLLSESLNDKNLKEKLLLKFAFHYTLRGGRGAWEILKRF